MRAHLVGLQLAGACPQRLVLLLQLRRLGRQLRGALHGRAHLGLLPLQLLLKPVNAGTPGFSASLEWGRNPNPGPPPEHSAAVITILKRAADVGSGLAAFNASGFRAQGQLLLGL